MTNGSDRARAAWATRHDVEARIIARFPTYKSWSKAQLAEAALFLVGYCPGDEWQCGVAYVEMLVRELRTAAQSNSGEK